MVEVLCHKTEDPWLDSRWGLWNFSSDLILLSTFSSPGVDTAANRNEYQVKCSRRVELTTLSSKVLPNVKARIEAQHFIHLLSLHDLLSFIIQVKWTDVFKMQLRMQFLHPT